MPYRYSRDVQLKGRLLEWTAWLFLFPWTRNKLQSTHSLDEIKVLFVEPFQMGDVLSVTPLIAPLLNRYPNARIYFLTKPSSGAILRLDKRVVKVFDFDFVWTDYGRKRRVGVGYVFRLFSMLIQLRAYHFAMGIDTRGDIRSQILLALCGCHSRIGYVAYLASNFTIQGRLLSDRMMGELPCHRYDWNMNLLPLAGCPSDSIRFPSFYPTLDETPIHEFSERYLLLHIGGGWKYKQWDTRNWGQVVDALMEHPGIDIIVIGGPSERDQIREVQALIRHKEKATFKITSLEELVALVSHCELFVGLDSGPMNLAVCLGKPVVALFGPGDSTMWYPYGSPESAIHHVEGFPCNPCKQVACEFPSHPCMSKISVDEVVTLVRKKLTS